MSPTSAMPVVIAGGGLSGLCAAYQLAKHNIDFQLVEARDRLGGRILVEPASRPSYQSEAMIPAVDMGPSWFWAGQSHLLQLIEELNLSNHVYLQASDGLSVVEYADGSIKKGQGAASMAGSYRLDGGMQLLIDTLVLRIGSAGVISTGSPVALIAQSDHGIETEVAFSGSKRRIESAQLILAIPPRVVVQSIEFLDRLPSLEKDTLGSIPTWMAAHAKLVAVYEEPFWQSTGLSGDAFSQLGPLVEIHDASPRTGGRHALFGFVGTDPEQRGIQAEAVKKESVQQLVRLFGPQAGNTVEVYLQDWAQEAHTCTLRDLEPGGQTATDQRVPDTEWEGRIVWAGTETAPLGRHSNGYLEGAVESGLRAANRVVEQLAGS